jgi:hypothetical protein
LAWGGTLGFALLVKWTAPVYLLLPTFYALGCGLNQERQVDANPLWKRILVLILAPVQQVYRTRFRLPSLKQWREVVSAQTGALLIAAVLYWSNRDRMDEFILGHWIPVFWMLLFAATLYVLRLPPGVGTNFWSALLLAASIASVWYFPRIDFLNRLTDVAFGTDRGTQEALDLLRLNNYTRYFGYLRSHHMGLLGMCTILPAALWGGFEWGRRRMGASPDQGRVVCWLAIISTYLLLAVIAQATPRNLNPILPLIAIVFTDCLRSQIRPIALAIGAIWLVVLGLQWSIYTFDSMAWLYARAPQLWVSGDYLAWPATGSSDPGYWIQPDVLETIGNPQDEAASFGMLIDSWELHRGSFRFLIAAMHLNIELMALTEPTSRGWSDLLANQWVLLKDGDNSAVYETGRQVIRRILSSDPLFRLLYKEVKRYTLPNGETAILYHRAAGPAHPYKYPVVLIETTPIAEAINRYWSKGATLYFPNIDTATWIGIHDLKADQIVMPQAANETAATLLAETVGPIFAATRYDTPEVQRWLFANGYPAVEVGDGEFHLTIVGRPSMPLAPLPVATRWQRVELPAIYSLPVLQAGDVLPVDVRAAGQVDGSLKISLRMIDPGGHVIAQQDKLIEPQFRLGLLVPPDAPAGQYTLAGVVYDPATMQPLPDVNGMEAGELSTIEVQGGSLATAPHIPRTFIPLPLRGTVASSAGDVVIPFRQWEQSRDAPSATNMVGEKVRSMVR